MLHGLPPYSLSSLDPQLKVYMFPNILLKFLPKQFAYFQSRQFEVSDDFQGQKSHRLGRQEGEKARGNGMGYA